MQAEVAHILKDLEKVLYGDGRDVHYKKEQDFTTIPGKSCSNGVILHFDQDDEKHEVNCYITWNGITIPVRYDLPKADLPGGRNYVNMARLLTKYVRSFSPYKGTYPRTF